MKLTTLIPLLLCLLVAYLLPWVINPGASLSPGGYDLAEWATIHPAAMGENPPLLTGLLLRLPLLCAALAFAFWLQPSTTNRVIGAVIVILMGIALLPPFEFLDDPGNWNYRQQIALAVVTVIGGLFGVTGWLRSVRPIIGVFAALMGAAACMLGLSSVFSLMQTFNLPVSIGAGAIFTTVVFLVGVAIQTQTGQRLWRRHPIPAIQR